MSEPIGPGDWVEYIETRPRHGTGIFWEDIPDLEVGAIYRVNAIIDGGFFDDGLPSLELCEFPGCTRGGDRFCWDVESFRPIYRPRADLIESLKAPPIHELVE